jgi:hypothetical protein
MADKLKADLVSTERMLSLFSFPQLPCDRPPTGTLVLAMHHSLQPVIAARLADQNPDVGQQSQTVLHGSKES